MTVPSQYAGTCPVCQVSWAINDQIHLQKGSDGKWIKCKDEECFKQQGGTIRAAGTAGKFTSSKFHISKAPEIYNMAEALLDTFYQKRNFLVTLGTYASPKLALESEAQFIESMFKTLGGNFKE